MVKPGLHRMQELRLDIFACRNLGSAGPTPAAGHAQGPGLAHRAELTFLLGDRSHSALCDGVSHAGHLHGVLRQLCCGRPQPS